jgi:tetratricopeptide (TPR) repeat protein
MVPQSARLTGIIAAAALALGGCAATPFGPSGPAPLPPPQRSGESADGAASPSSRDPAPGGVGRQTNQAAAALLTESRAASAAGDHAAAAVTLERALAIDPNDALLWIELAEVRWRQGDREQAESLARKALTIAGDDGLVIDRAERLIGRR